MDLISECALGVAKVGWQPRHGSFAFTVVCKATFELRPEISPLAATQVPVVEADVYTGEGGGLALASELVPFKKRPEVLVVGHAYAPEGRPVPSLGVRLAVGDIDKAIQVVGDRCVGRDGLLGDPAPFTTMPLVWERAAGGPATSNPAGRPLGSAARADVSGRVLAPNLLPVGLRLASCSAIVPPVGFGPIAPNWPSRVACLQRHGAWWEPSRWHERPLPDDIDMAYFNAAPPDQQRTQPFGEEAIYLENMHPHFARLSTRLAPVAPAVTVDHGSGPQRLQLRCDTLVIDTDRGLAMLVWRAHVLLDRPDRPGRAVVSGPGTPAAAPSAQAHDEPGAEATLLPNAVMLSSVVLPFSGTAARASSSVSPLTTASKTGPASASAAVAAERRSQPSVSAISPPFAENPLEKTEAPGLTVSSLMLPFATAQEQSVSGRDVPPRASAAGLPLVPPWVRGEGEAAPPSRRPDQQGATGPATAAKADSKDEPGGGAEPAPEVPFEAYPPERCGAIAARLACDPGSTRDLLRAEELDEARWQRVHAHWLDRIHDEAARSRKMLLSSYDGAYVAALDAKRGPIAVSDYARLADAAERSALAGALAERDLPEGAWPHIHRVWIQRMVKDVRLGKLVRREIDALRAGPCAS
ncbi:DUF2169 domain-containing protein [Sorangium sp. So ce834]|uniref:DUF2169 family type VI secretion system accessory protein n=1 Tax=Sorangium sp. So ce834 TaxID=3133321 RepID=UPI003F642407